MLKILFMIWLSATTAISFSQFKITGHISSKEKTNLPSVAIIIHELNRVTTSDLSGDFIFNQVPKGRYHIHIENFGFKPYDVDTVLNQNIDIRIILTPSINELNEVIIEIDPLKLDKKRSSLSIRSIENKTLRQMTSNSLSNTLAKIEGIQSVNNGATVAKPVIRGFQNNRISIIADNIKQEEQQWASDHGLAIDQFEIDRVILLKGPSSLIYGSDAIGGILKFDKNHQLPENALNSVTSTYFRSVNNSIGIFSKLNLNKNKNYFSARFGLTDYGDYQVPATDYTYLGYIIPIDNKTLKNTAGKEINGALTFGKNFDNGFSRITFSNFNQYVGVFPGAVGLPAYYNLNADGSRNITLPSQRSNHFKIASETNFAIKENWLELNIGYQNNIRKEYGLPEASGFPYSADTSILSELQLNTLSANSTYHFAPHKKHEDIIGLQITHQTNRSQGFEYTLADYNWFNSGVYAIKKWERGPITINGGLRIDYSYLTSKESLYPFYSQRSYISDIIRSNSFTKTYLSWAGNIGLSHEINNHNTYKFNLGKSFRAPQPYELTANGAHSGVFQFVQGNQTLSPEEAWQLDLVYEYEKKAHHLKVTPFVTYFTNYIYLTPSNKFPTVQVNSIEYPYPETGQLYVYKEDRSIFYGTEMLYHVHPIKWITVGIQGDFVIADNLNQNRPLPMMSPTRLKIFSTIDKHYQKKSFYLTISTEHTFSQNRVDKNEKKTAGYILLGIETGVSYKKTDLKINIENVTNNRYLKHLSTYRQLNIPEPGINFNVMLSYRFSTSLENKEIRN